MHGFDRLIRVSDGKYFEIKHHGHWSDIVAHDGETDSIKWTWGNGVGPSGAIYISHSKGHHYYIDANGRTEERYQAYCAREQAKYT